MPASKHRRRGKHRLRDRTQGAARSSRQFTEKGLLVAALLAQQFGATQPTDEALAAFIAETPLLHGLDPETALVLWAYAIHAVEHEHPELLAELDSPAEPHSD